MEKVRRALSNKEDDEKQQASLDSVRTEFQARYQQAFTQRQHDVFTTRTRLTENERYMSTEPAHAVEASNRADGETSSGIREATYEDTVDLTVTFERVTLSEKSAVPPRDSIRNPFLGSQQQEKKKPHYVEVLERSDDSVTKPRFKLNQ